MMLSCVSILFTSFNNCTDVYLRLLSLSLALLVAGGKALFVAHLVALRAFLRPLRHYLVIQARKQRADGSAARQRQQFYQSCPKIIHGLFLSLKPRNIPHRNYTSQTNKEERLL